MVLRCNRNFVHGTAGIFQLNFNVWQQKAILFTIVYFLLIVFLEYNTVFLFCGELFLLEKNRID